MKNIIIDTCVIIHIVRESESGKRCLEALSNFDDEPNIIISVVTKAEIESFSVQNNWGATKIDKLNKVLNQITYIDISNNDKTLVSAYTQIDAFSKRKMKDKNGSLLNGSARKMGKNDIWIASTAYALNIPLITTDGDFDHLNNTLINVIKIS
jgi:tRNA(fMet)-specific endonuclease VapC